MRLNLNMAICPFLAFSLKLFFFKQKENKLKRISHRADNDSMIQTSEDRKVKTVTYDDLRAELIQALRDCGFSEKEIFEDLDSSEYGRATDRE